MEIRVIERTCRKCHTRYGYSWIGGLNYVQNLKEHGWRKIKDIWICPECVDRRHHGTT